MFTVRAWYYRADGSVQHHFNNWRANWPVANADEALALYFQVCNGDWHKVQVTGPSGFFREYELRTKA